MLTRARTSRLLPCIQFETGLRQQGSFDSVGPDWYRVYDELSGSGLWMPSVFEPGCWVKNPNQGLRGKAPNLESMFMPSICSIPNTRAYTSKPANRRKRQVRVQIEGPYFESVELMSPLQHQ